MKKLYLLIAILFIGLYSCKAQLNELTQDEYYGIKINNITFKSISDTNADLTQMRALFGSDVLYEYSNDILITKKFWKSNFYFFAFDSDLGNEYFLTYFKIRNSSVSVTVKEITAYIGDDVSVFGNNVVINTNNGSNSAVFIDALTGSTALAFKIDKVTSKIIEIEFNAY